MKRQKPGDALWSNTLRLKQIALTSNSLAAASEIRRHLTPAAPSSLFLYSQDVTRPMCEDERALDLQCFTKALFLTKNQSKFHLLTTPEVELLVSALKPDDAAYNLYVGMVTFQPGSCKCISELQSVEL